MSKKVEEEFPKEFHELQGLRLQEDKIEEAYRQVFPKVDPFLVHDLYLRIQEDPESKEVGPMYTVEVFTKEGTDPEASKRHILRQPVWSPLYMTRVLTT